MIITLNYRKVIASLNPVTYIEKRMKNTEALEIYKYIACFVALILSTIRVGGIHFIFLFFIKMLRLDFIERKIRTVSNEFYDIKLFKFLTGIRARSIKDVIFIQECINSGKILAINFLFSGFFGYAGSKRSNKFELIFLLLISISSLLLAIVTTQQANVYMKDYAIYIFDDGTKYYINSERILKSKNGSELNCRKTTNLNPVEKKHADDLCPYLDNKKPIMRRAVLDGIEKNNSGRATFITLSLVFFAISLIIPIGFVNFNFSSAQLRKLKLAHIIKSRQCRKKPST